MAIVEKKVACPFCRKPFRAAPAISPLGFQKYACPNCGRTILHPLFRRRYYWMALAVLGAAALFSLAGYSAQPWGDKLLAAAVLSTIYVMERVSYLLFPLAAWAVLRLFGISYPWALSAARTVLRYTGMAALAGLFIAILGGVASLVWRGIVLEPFLASIILSFGFLAVLIRDRAIRARLQKT
ncbi:membrane hypothetical protein [uncultured Desulfatiglans sp.]|nr:membrane hypothetical protein [uncultured Desulfatiglans sp.]